MSTKLFEYLQAINIFLKELERKMAGFIAFVIFANICIFLYECNQGRMIEKDPSDREFLVKKIEYGKTKNSIHVQEISPINPNSLYQTYFLEVNLTKKELSKLKVKKDKIIIINATISENAVGKKVMVLNKIKFNKKLTYTLRND